MSNSTTRRKTDFGAWRCLFALLAFSCGGRADAYGDSETHFLSCEETLDCATLGLDYVCNAGICEQGADAAAETSTGASSSGGSGSAGDTSSAGGSGGALNIAGTGGSTTGGSATGGSESDPNAACAELQRGNDRGWSIGVRIINQTSQVIHVGPQYAAACESVPLFQVLDDADHALSALPSCPTWCASVTQGVASCPPICPLSGSITLNPSQNVEVTWNGLYRVGVSVPDECRPVGGPVVCDRAEQVEPGNFTFTAQAGTEINCPEDFGTCDDCISRIGGSCVTAGLIAGTILSAETTVDLGAGYGVGDFTSDGTSGPPAPVMIVFSD